MIVHFIIVENTPYPYGHFYIANCVLQSLITDHEHIN